MKFLHYFALIASTSAIRLEDVPLTKMPGYGSMLELEKHVYSPEEVFEHFDKDKSGTWSLKEMKAAFKGVMASSQGKANAAPAPLRSVRRDKGVGWV